MLKLNNVSFKYDTVLQNNSLSEINLFIEKGEVVILCGESGCGKTTLTRLINGLIPHYYNGRLSGEIIVNGKNLLAMPLYETAKMVGSVFQNPRSQFYCMDTNSELAFGCENQGLPPDDIDKRIKLTVSHLEIHSLMNRNIFHLSGGEKQKIACGCVHTASPDVIVLDEPSSNLDPQATKTLAQIIAHWKSEGKTIVIAEHRLHYLRDIADRIVFLSNGTVEKVLSITEARKLKTDELFAMGLRPLSLESLTPEKQPGFFNSERIELLAFNYSYNRRGLKALDIGSLNLPKGQIIGIIGNNGAGKTTFAKCLCGLNKQFKGKLRVGNSIYRNKECLENAYMVMQDVNHQLFTETVFDEVLLSMKEDDPVKAEDILDSLNLNHLRESHPMALSGGQKQRVAIAGAVASEREIIIFDEPTSGLDLYHMIQVSNNLKQLKDLGKTVIVITHDLELIMSACDYVLYFKKGNVYQAFTLNSKKINQLINFFQVNRI